MTDFTSVQDGDWDAATTWDVGSGYPDGTDDTATLAQGHEVTIPSDLTVNPGAITMNAGASAADRTKLILAGTLDLGGAVSIAGQTEFNISGGATLDLNGFDITRSAANSFYNFIGTSGNRVTVISTTSAGSFLGSVNEVYCDLQYVDFSGCATLALGRTGNAATGFINAQYCTWDDCGDIQLDIIGAGANAGFLVSHCDFSNPRAAAQLYPYILQNKTGSSQQRLIEYCTWDCNTSNKYATVEIKTKDAIIENSVLSGVRLKTEGSVADSNVIIQDCYHENINGIADGNLGVPNTVNGITYQRNYVYDTEANHPFSGANAFSSQPLAFKDNVFEITASGTNVILNPAGNAQITISGNLHIGKGNFVTYSNTSDQNVLLDINNNTFYVDNDGTQSAGQDLAICFLKEGTATSALGTVEIWNNIYADPDGGDTQDAFIDLINATADQVDYCDYNAEWAYPTARGSLEYNNVTVTAGLAANDISANPDFVDKTRDIAAWDTSLGGAGTKANALTEMLKMNGAGYNSAYNPADLVTYVRAGFVPQNTAYQGTGRNADDLGALTVVPAGIERLIRDVTRDVTSNVTKSLWFEA